MKRFEISSDNFIAILLVVGLILGIIVAKGLEVLGMATPHTGFVFFITTFGFPIIGNALVERVASKQT